MFIKENRHPKLQVRLRANCTEVWELFLTFGLGTSLFVECILTVFVYAQSYCLEDLVGLHTCLGCDSWKASGIASDAVLLSNRTFSIRRGSD